MISDTDQAVFRMRDDLVSGAFRRWRKSRGMTGVEFCRESGVNYSNLWRWETGREVASYENALRVLRFVEETEASAGKPQASRRR